MYRLSLYLAIFRAQLDNAIPQKAWETTALCRAGARARRARACRARHVAASQRPQRRVMCVSCVISARAPCALSSPCSLSYILCVHGCALMSRMTSADCLAIERQEPCVLSAQDALAHRKNAKQGGVLYARRTDEYAPFQLNMPEKCVFSTMLFLWAKTPIMPKETQA